MDTFTNNIRKSFPWITNHYIFILLFITIQPDSIQCEIDFDESTDPFSCDMDFGDWKGKTIPLIIKGLEPGESIWYVSNKLTKEQIPIKVKVIK